MQGARDVSEAVGNLLVTDEELSSARAEVHAASKKARRLRHKQRKRLEKQNQQLSPDSSDRLTPRDLSETDSYGGMSPEQRQQADEETQFLHKLFCCPITQVSLSAVVLFYHGHSVRQRCHVCLQQAALALLYLQPCSDLHDCAACKVLSLLSYRTKTCVFFGLVLPQSVCALLDPRSCIAWLICLPWNITITINIIISIMY